MATARVKDTPTKEQILEFRKLKKAEVDLVREMSKKDLWTFITKVLFPDDPTANELTRWTFHYSEDLHRPLADFVTHQATYGARKLILMPRMHRKSYIVTISHIIWRIINDPDVRVLLISGLDRTSKMFAGSIKRIFQHNAGIKKYFPEFHVPPGQQFGNETSFTHPQRSVEMVHDPNPTLRASYLGAPLAGSRCDILICDDPVEKKHVTTPEQADKALHNFNDLIPLVDENPKYNMVFVIGTRWSFNDIYGAILGEDRGDEAEAGLETSENYQFMIRHCLEDKDGNPDFTNGAPIFPKRFNRQKLMSVLSEYRRDPKKGEEDFWKQMMNVCISPSGRKFYEEWFDNWVPRLPGNIIFSAILVDSATKDEQIIMRGDYTACLCVHMDGYGHVYVTDGLHDSTFKSPDLMRSLKALSQKHNSFNIIKEKVGEEMFFGMVKESYLQSNLPINTIACSVRGQGKKVVRIVEALQQPFMEGKVHFVGDPQRKEGFSYRIWRKLKDELLHIGQWAHDDLADALSLIFHKDVRIQPQQLYSKEWTIPRNARLPQKGDTRSWRSPQHATDGGDVRGHDPFTGIPVNMEASREEFLSREADS